jgi:DNA-binding NtrC family response regulator
MNKPTILIFGKDQDNNVALVNRLNDQFNSITVATDEMAIEKIQQSHIDAVIFEKDVPDAEKRKLEKIFSLQSGDVVFIEHALQADLTTTILQTIENKRKENKPSFAFRDDALKNAGLNIQIQ